MTRFLVWAMSLLAPVAAAAHPHVFVEAGLRLIVDGSGRLEAVEVGWTYDELYSLLILEDKGLDADGDGVLNSSEQAALAGFDMNWVADFAGDLFLQKGDAALELGRPVPLSTELGKDGRITTWHRRAVGVPAQDVVVQAYDPTFYTAYDLGGGVEVIGGCVADITPVDLNAAYSALEEILYGMPQAEAEVAFPEVGQKFADTVVLRCGQ
ncbi:DUF1007 family protein [Aliishimia ponticola]|uniref:DUF1007 family protein n=2 Tax=Aliishimia ponticola TaxID=2499833 RepID=A0A4S4NMN4_9RHOB|nr:DUF1007 family protein [Aliishimia ponticola]